ncbi:MAG: bifunctional homocysteine S-methyltransferase/methylenetetrahydrofolate reductase [Caldilineales bacterium]|nr:bifunctional homocysteine S-methyltransferase/methylenetetrahydrofolate reductase [Caldilineales bacterium]MCW5858749.1 bifunctional homocysteine S-methyltransferase/methylenetetrahydrofolate reductase [Caldilineales bacterium]
MRTDFRTRIEAGLLLCDGAMGTELFARGFAIDQSLESLNLTHPDIVRAIHRAYLEAGADLIEANTFGANRIRQEEFGLADQAAALATAGVALAIEARAQSNRPQTLVGASIGPLGKYLAPYGPLAAETARAAYHETIVALAEAGADVLIFETFSDLNELLLAVQVARAIADLPIVAHMTFDEEGRTALGHLPEDVALALAAAGVDVAGANCSVGPAVVAAMVERMHRAAPSLALSALPNAGFPRRVGGRMAYPSSPDYFAGHLPAFQSMGVRLIGGCCGTTAAHIAALRAALDGIAGRRPAPSLWAETPDLPEIRAEVAPPPTALAQALAERFVITVEMSPPRGYDPNRLVEQAQMLRDAGVTAIDMADSPRARMRMSPWAASFLVQSRLGMETILHFPTRGRNLLRVQGDLLAAHALNIRNLFVVMGDPTRIGDFPDAADNYDVTPSGLVELVKHNLNRGVDQAGQPIGLPTHFFVGAALNLDAENPEQEIKVLRRKLDGGADFLLTQPVFDPTASDRFRAAWGGPLPVPVIAGLLPLTSSRHAEYLHHEIPGLSIPQRLRDLMAKAADPEAEGIAIARDLLAHLRTWANGAYFMPPFGRHQLVAAVLGGARSRE